MNAPLIMEYSITLQSQHRAMLLCWHIFCWTKQSLKRALAVSTILHGNFLKRALALLQTYNLFYFILFIFCFSVFYVQFYHLKHNNVVLLPHRSSLSQHLIMCSHAGIMKRCRKSLTSEPSLLQILSG